MDVPPRAAPHVVVLGGPNGAGKSTVAPRLLRDALGMTTFVNADDIARGLSGFAPEAVALRAGRLMLDRLAELTRGRATFAFESTLAGLGMRDVLARCRDAGYRVHLVYLWLASPELALARVRRRVAAGGHDLPLATTWRVYDGSAPGTDPVVAHAEAGRPPAVRNAAVWATINAQADAIRRGDPSP